MNEPAGRAVIDVRQPVTAGSFQTITYGFTAGHPIDDTGSLKIVFRYAGDFGTPQFDNSRRDNYCSIFTSGNCRIEPRWDIKGHVRPWGKSLYLKVMGGYLDTGDKITVVFGDTANGSPGWQIQTFCEDSFEFKTLVDPIATCQFKELSSSPVLRIVAGPPEKAVCLAPSCITINTPFTYHLKLEDRWGNPVKKPPTLKHPGFGAPGIRRIDGFDSKTGLQAESNPIRVLKEKGGLNPYWADFHGQSEETIGSNTIEDYFSFARDFGLVDICGHQGNDFQITDSFWKKIGKLAKTYSEPGRFLVFPGYEWSGNTPLGGDRNVYFAGPGGEITRSSNELLPGGTSVYPVSPTANDLFRELKAQYKSKPFTFAHVGGRYPSLNMHDSEIETAIEIHSSWGTFEWLLEDALSRGYFVGVCCNSDGHKGRPGASYPGAGRFGSYGGLTCVLASTLDRGAVYTAIKARHMYGTTGNRSLLEVNVLTSDGRTGMMGDVIQAGKGDVHLIVRTAGTAPVENVEVRNGLKSVTTVRTYSPLDLGQRIKVTWSGAEVRGRARMVDWTGSLTVTGNSIRNVQPVNFWHADKPLRRMNQKRIEWESITTGGIAGCILDLAKPGSGEIIIETRQGKAVFSLDGIGMVPKNRRYKGVKKMLELCRLPNQLTKKEFSFEMPLKRLRKGDNPIYVRMVQEDGHMAWSSPIYVRV